MSGRMGGPRLRRSPTRRTRPSRRPDDIAVLKRRITFVALIVTFAALVVLDRSGCLLAPRPDVAAFDGVETRVVRVVDGDTFIIDIPDPREGDATTRVRLLGVDTPELGRGGEPDEPYAREAAAFAVELVEGRTVTVVLEPHRERDRWGRLLAHIDTGDGELLGAALLEAGLARAETRWPHAWRDWYVRIELAAKRERIGMWSD